VNLVYNYDALNRLTNVLANGNWVAGYTYDLAGNLQSLSYGNGVTNLYQYDSLNRLTNLVWKTNGTTTASFAYQLGLTGTRTNLSENVNGISRTYRWQYDLLYRLTNETVTGTVPTGTLGYNYDAVGNRLIRTNLVSGLGLTNQLFAFNTNDWLMTDQYDNNGNTTNASGNTYQYDALNHITNVNSGAILMMYDGDGNRVSKIVGGTTTYYLLDDRNPSGYAQVLEEYRGANNYYRIYNYGLDLISQRQRVLASTNYFIYDGHGSTRVLTDAGGKVSNAFVYDAFGKLIASNAVPQTANLYCGEQFDSDLGFSYLRARYYSPQVGRFWTMDTYTGNNEDPLSLHKYLYCHSDPINFTDPSGHFEGLAGLMANIYIRSVMYGLVIVAGTQVIVQSANMYGDHAPDPVTQKPKLDRVLRFLTSMSHWSAEVQPYETIAAGARYRVYDDPLDDKDWGLTRLYGQLFIHTIHLNERSFDLSDQLLASHLIHEAVHTTQYKGSSAEFQAYEIQSKALKDMGITGSISSDSFTRRFTAKNDSSYCLDVVLNMEEANIQNPAIKR
jgi:RHS repeat-associated protein